VRGGIALATLRPGDFTRVGYARELGS
jgi:hypothetical protein